MSSLINNFFQILNSSLQVISPRFIFQNKIKISSSTIEFENSQLNLSQFKRIFVIGFGKASSAMATELEKYLLDKIEDGVVITKYGFKTPTKKIKVYEAGHPIPDENSLKYSQEIIRLCENLTRNDLIICLISGGGSALFEVLNPKIDLNTLRLINKYLLKQKISIYEINRVRKALSNVKDGKLLNYLYPATCLSFIISDVVGNDISVIASGPTYINDQRTFLELKDFERLRTILQKENLINEFDDLIEEKEYDRTILKYFDEKVYNLIISSNQDAVETAKNTATSLGYEIHRIEYNILSSTEEVSKKIIKEMIDLNDNDNNFKKAIIFGGETFLNVTGNGLGGRNSHLVLQIVNEIISREIELDFNFLIASVATDGNDGPTDAAGAYITNEILETIKNSNINPSDYLKNFDSYNFFNAFGCLIKTGVTNTNVADLMIGLFEK